MSYHNFLNDLEMFKSVSSKGNDVNRQDKDGKTLLMQASYEGSLEEVKALIKAGAFVNVQNKDGITALMGASHQGYFDIVEILLQNKAIIDLQDKRGDSALSFSMKEKYYDTASILVKHSKKEDDLWLFENVIDINLAKCLLVSGNVVKFYFSFLSPYLSQEILSSMELIYSFLRLESFKDKKRQDEVDLYRKDPIEYILRCSKHPLFALKSINNLEHQGYLEDSIDKVRNCLLEAEIGDDLEDLCGKDGLHYEL